MAFTSKIVLLLLLSILALCQASSQGNTVTERVLHGFKDVTTACDNLRVATQKINNFNAPQQGFIIAEGFTGIASKISHGIEKMNAESSLSLPAADEIVVVQALRAFVHVHTTLLNVVIGKHGLRSMVPFFEPIGVSLASLEIVIDTFAPDLIALIPSQHAAAEFQFRSLSVTLKMAKHVYRQPFLSSEYDDDTNSTTEKILQGIGTVTDLSDALRVATLQLNEFNAGQQGFIIAEGFTNIIAKIAKGTVRTERVTDGPLPDDAAVLVVEALTTFVQVHQALLNVVIGKHGLLALIPFFGPIRLALVDLEAAIDALAYDLIALIPTQKPAADEQFSSLSVTLTQAINTYSGPYVATESRMSSEYDDTNTTTEKILQGIGNVTALSSDLRIATLQLNEFNAGQQGFIIAEGFTNIIAKIAEGTVRTQRVTDGPLPDDAAVLVVEALTTFVQVHQALLNVVIGKHGLLALIPFFGPIRIALVDLEAAIDALAYDLIALIPTQKPAADDQFASLSVTLTQAINTYGGPFAATESRMSSESFVAAKLRMWIESEVTYTTTERILQGFETVTTMSDNLRVDTVKINEFNAGQQGFIIAEGFTNIVAKIAEGTVRTERVADGPLSDDDAVLVVEALTTFVQVHQALLNVVIGKHGLLALVPFFEPIRVALVSLEAVIDTFAFDLIGLIPTQQPAAEAQFGSLSVTLKQAQNTYGLHPVLKAVA